MDPPRYHHLSKVGKKIGLENEFFSVTAFADYRHMPSFPSYSSFLFVEACASERVRVISIARLPTLPPLHLRPIYVIVFNDPIWKSYLEGGFVLRCFQHLSLPNAATRPCTWRYNRLTGGSSNTVLSY